MPCLKLHTTINASQKVCFDLSRSIDLHKISTSHTNEQAIDGRTTGLISKGEYVTWEAKHFGIYLTLTSKITECTPYTSFTDEMVKGPFKSIRHIHNFEVADNETLMTDEFHYDSPLGILGSLFNFMILNSYLKRLLTKRNQIIKLYAESELWKKMIQ